MYKNKRFLILLGTVVFCAAIGGISIQLGISAEEYEVFAEQHGIEVLPKQFSPDAHRYLMMASPFRVMRVLGSMGYRIPVTPAGGRVPTATGERRMGVYTLVKEYLGDRNVELSI